MQVKVSTPQIVLDKIFEGVNSEEVVKAMQIEAATHVPFLLRHLVTGMAPLQFVHEIVRRYNDAMKTNLPSPSSCDEFIQIGVNEGFATILEK